MQRLALETVFLTLLLVASPMLVAQDQLTHRTVDTSVYTAPDGAAPPPSGITGNLLNSVLFDGDAPLGATYNTTDEVLAVLDLFDGSAYLYETDLTATGDEVVAPRGPAGAATGWPIHTGMAFVPGDASDDDAFEEDGYLFIVLDVNATFTALVFFAVRTDLDGDEIDSVEFGTLADVGSLGGVAFDANNGTFWVDDIVNDEYLEFTYDPDDDEIVPTGRVFKNPVGSQFGALGNGVEVAEECFIVPAGSIFDGQVTALHFVDAGGGPASNPVSTDQVVDLAGIGDTFINGVAYCPEGSDGGPICFVVGNATNTIYEIEFDRDCDGCTIDGAPTNMEAAESDPGTLTVTWDIPDPTDVETIEIVVDGEVAGTADDVFDGTIDVTVTSGLHEVTIRYSDGTDTCDMATCLVPVNSDAAFSVTVPPLIGGAPPALFGITVNERDNLILLPDLFGGQTVVTNRELDDFDFEFSPTTDVVGETTTTWFDMVWIEGDTADDDRYYFLTDNDLGVFQLLETDTGFGSVGQVDLDPPGGGPTWGMDCNAAGDGLIINDVGDDAYYLFNFDGSTQDDAMGEPISFPVPLPPVPAFLGNGIAKLNGGLGYAVPTAEAGTTPFGGPDELIFVDPDGELLGCSETLGPIGDGSYPVYDPFVNGLVFTETGPDDADGDWCYAVGNSFGLVFVSEMPCDPCRPVSGLTCTQEDGTVELEWEVEEADADAIAVYRGDVMIADLDGDATSYTDDDIDDYGDLSYTVMTTCSAGSSGSTCDISVPDPDANVLIFDLETSGERDSAGTVGALLDSFLELTCTTVGSIDGVDLEQFDAVFVFCGTAPNVGSLTTEQGEAISDWLLLGLGGACYIEGGDYAAAEILPFFDNTDLHDNDGTSIIDDGERICDVGSVAGLAGDFDSAPDLSDVEASHDCEGGFIDELDLGTDAGAAVILENGDDDAHDLMVFHDGDESIGFTYRTLVSAIELAALSDITIGGADAELIDLLEILYEALTGDDITVGGGGGPEFIRCDCDSNQDFSALLDALFMMRYGFAGGDVPECFRACDCDGNDDFSPLLDALRALQYFFAGGDIPPEPFETCGEDTLGLSDSVDCETAPGCP